MKMFHGRSMTVHLFSIYMIILFWAILYKFSLNFSLEAVYASRSVNLIPLAGSFASDGSFCIAEFLFNIAAFIPFGIYLTAANPKLSGHKKMLIFFLISLLFETTQLIFKIGVFDTTDLLTNTLGGMIGVLICKEIIHTFKRRSREMINAIGAAGTTGVCAVLGVYLTGAIAS